MGICSSNRLRKSWKMFLGIVLVAALALVAGDKDAEDRAFMKDIRDGKYQFGGPPEGKTVVETWIYVPGIMIYDDKPIWASEMYYGMNWNDSRLVHNGDHFLPYQFRNNIWKPSIFFKESAKASMTMYPTPAEFTQVHSSGYVKVNMRVLTKSLCRDLIKRENEVTCTLTTEMYAEQADRVEIVGPALYNPNYESIMTSGWKMTDHKVTDCQQTYATGTFACKRITFKMMKMKNDSGSDEDGDD